MTVYLAESVRIKPRAVGPSTLDGSTRRRDPGWFDAEDLRAAFGAESYARLVEREIIVEIP